MDSCWRAHGTVGAGLVRMSLPPPHEIDFILQFGATENPLAIQVRFSVRYQVSAGAPNCSTSLAPTTVGFRPVPSGKHQISRQDGRYPTGAIREDLGQKHLLDTEDSWATQCHQGSTRYHSRIAGIRPISSGIAAVSVPGILFDFPTTTTTTVTTSS